MRQLKDLHNYQREAVRHCMEHDRAGLFLDMGLGKTVTAYTVIKKRMFETFDVNRVLVIGTKRVAQNVWPSEVNEWEHLHGLRVEVVKGTPKQREAILKKDADVFCIGRDSVAWLCGLFGGSFLPFDMVIIDELSSFKNHQSQRFKALQAASVAVPYIIGLTGTPAPKGLVDLWAQVFLLDRGKRLGRTISAFRESFLKQSYRSVHEWELRQGSETEIHERIKDICISMSAKDYLELPARLDNIVKVYLDEDTQDRYNDFEKSLVLELIENGETLTAANSTALQTKLQQFADGIIYDTDKNPVFIHGAKFDALDEIIEANEGKPIIIGYAYRSVREALFKHLKHLKPRELNSKADEDEWNAGKIKCLIMHPASGGHGLNLQKGGNILVWFGNTWSLELEQQFNARIHRQGQTERVQIHKLVAVGTVDETIIQSQQRKDATQSALLAATKLLIQKYKTI